MQSQAQQVVTSKADIVNLDQTVVNVHLAFQVPTGMPRASFTVGISVPWAMSLPLIFASSPKIYS